MASQFATLAIFVLVALPSVALAMQWIVGDDSGWTNGYNYTDWAKDKVFRVGDSLLFRYQVPNHNVFKVNLTDFRACNIPPAKVAFATGHDVIHLMTPGVKWYICGIGQHCANFNQKLKITVVSDAEAPVAPPATPGNSTPAAPPPTPGNSGANAVVWAGFRILAAAVVALVLVAV